MVELSVVIPAHNEAENLPLLVEEIHRALQGVADYEIMVVDDHSPDATPQVLARLHTENPRLRSVRHAMQRGQSAGVVTGVRQSRGEWIATLDGDGQNDPADIAVLWRNLQVRGDKDQVVLAGWRQKRRDNGLRRISSRLANRFRARCLRDNTPDTGCGLKLFRREDFLRLPAFNHMHRFLPALFQREGKTVVSVPVGHRPRLRGSSHYGVWNRLWVGLVDIAGLMWLIRRPVRVELE